MRRWLIVTILISIFALTGYLSAVYFGSRGDLLQIAEVAKIQLFGVDPSVDIFGDLIQPQIAPVTASFLDGMPTSDQRVIGVMIENHPQAREQQTGLSKARVVYETVSEGGITRFLALFNWSDESAIGPIRSARPYYVEWADEYNAAYVHAGGSDLSLQDIYTSSVFDIEALYWEEVSDYFWRDKRYYAPHNLFGTTDGIREIVSRKNWDANYPLGKFQFSQIPSVVVGSTVSEFTLDFSFAQYEVRYVYDSRSGRYRRYLNEKPHHDDQGPIEPSNVIVQFTRMYPYDPEGRMYINTIGSGEAFLFRNGSRFQGVWEKHEQGSPTRFYFLSGDEFALLPGQTWIEVLRHKNQVRF